MKQITILWLLLLFFGTSTVFSQSTTTAKMAAQDRAIKQAEKEKVVRSMEVFGTEQSPMEARKVMNSTDEQWDVLYTFSAQAPSCQAVATDGQNFYMTYWNGGGEFDKFDMDGNYLESFTIASAAAIRDFAYDGQYFYGAPSGGMSIAQLDLANQTVVSTITIAGDAGVTGSRHLSYDPELDGGNGGFWLGQWSELAAVDMSGNTIYSNSQTPAVASCYGSAYDPWTEPGSPKLWLFTQNEGASPYDLVMLEEFDITTLSFTGTTMDLFTISGDIPGYIPGTATSSTIAGGAVAYVDASNTYVLAANIQQSPNLVVGLELATTGPQPSNDVGVQGITSPNSGVNLTNAEPVTFAIKNYGTNSQSNIPWEITWDGPTGFETVSGTYTGPLAAGETADIDAGTADLSAIGDYDFEACTSLAGDENTGNDCKSKTVTNAFPEYCDASTTTEDEWIANVLCGSIDNSSGWQGGVADYTDISTSILPGQGEAITITNGNAWASDIVTCWVDWNMDYEFGVGTDEEFFTTNVGGTGQTFEGEIVVPAGTPNGQYRMRVRMTYSSAPEPCGNSAYGEVEDYTIVVGDPLAADVGVSSIDMATFYEPGSVTPMATVKNFGGDTQTFDVTMTIGSYSSTMTVTDLASGEEEQVSFDNWSAAEGSYTAEACTELAGDENPNNDCEMLGITVATGNFVFAYNAYDPSGALVEGPVTFDITNPGIVNLIAPTGSNDFIAGACWANDVWWGVQYGGGLYTIDTESGDMTFIGSSPDCSGLAFDGEKVYGASITDLYEIDPATGAGTLIGAMGNAGAVMIGIGCNAAGDLYGVDLGDDNFYSIDKATGAATVVGALGIDLNYAQDMAFDKAADVCYLSAYTTSGQLYTVDVATGLATYIADFQGGAEITGFAIPGATAPPAGDPPTVFDANFVENVGVETTWMDPQEMGTWVGYDDGVNAGGLGLNGGGEYWAAIRWEPADLAPFDGQYMTQFQFFPSLFAVEADITFMVWEGADASTLVYEQDLSGLNWDEWNTVELDAMHMIDASQELWIGFHVTHEDAEYPLGYDDGPAVAGYGDMVSFDGTTFESMATEYSIDNNFNLKAFIADEVDGVIGNKQPLPMPGISVTNTELVTTEFKPTAAPAETRLEFLGVNVYRDGSLVNPDPVAPGTQTYTDEFFENGTFMYTAKAVYDEGLSEATPPVEVTIVGAPEIEVTPASLSETHNDPPQVTTKDLTIANVGGMDLEWEATVSVNSKVNSSIKPVDPATYEGLLEARMAADGLTLPGPGEDQSPMEARKVMNSTDEQWDVLYTFSAQAPSCQAVATDGQNFYMTYWNGGGEFDKFDMDGNYLESFTIASAAAIRDFAYDGQYFYGAPSGGMSIAQLDLANQTVVSTITIAGDAGVTGSRHLSYDPELDGGNGGFWLGQWSELAAVDMSGNTIYSNSQTPAVASCYGSAYDPWTEPGSPKLWLFTQNEGASPYDLVMLEEFDIATLSFTGTTMDLFTISGDIPGYIPGTATSSTIAGGAVAYVDASNTYVLAANIQQSPNLVVGLELATTGPQPSNDVGVQGITSPNSGVNLTNAEPVMFNIKNYGTASQSNIPWEITWDGPTGTGSASGTYAGPLASGESAEIDAGTADLSSLGDYDFEACTSLAGDENTGNDCKTKTVTNAYPEYCDASTTTEDEWIANVLCGSIDNSSGWQGGVADYTDISTSIDAGSGEAITITNGNAWASDIVTIWVDWNMDYEFGVGTDEEFFTTNVGGTGETFTGEIFVPAGTPSGEYRMRVRMTYSSAPEPCGNSAYGEVEDYTIVVGGGGGDAWLSVAPMSGTVSGGGSETIEVTFNSTDLEEGTYTGTISITSNDPASPTVDVPVTLVVQGGGPQPSLVFEPFEDYVADDYLVQQAVAQGKEYWTTWSENPGSTEDPIVKNDIAYEGDNSVVIEGTNDAVLILPQNYTSGQFNIDFMVYIPTDKIGYFNCLQAFAGASSEWGMQAYFDVGGAGLVDAGGAGAGAFTYTYDTWHNVQLMIDLDADNAVMYFNGEMVVEWVWSSGSFGTGTLNEFHAMNFYAWAENGTPGAYFDNIDITQGGVVLPDPPTNFDATVDGMDAELSWEYAGIFEPEWITYSGETITNSIGTNAAADFDVAARWEPADLTNFENGAVTKINFVPGEPGDLCTYTLKVWQGAGNPTLIYEQELTEVVADVWNEVELDTPVPFDNTDELWIGFNCNTTAGFPAGCDDGPQVEGYSNMMFWNGAWVTLTSLNPDLIYNWAVQGYIEFAGDGEALLPINEKPVLVENAGNLTANPVKITPPAIFVPDATRSLYFNIYRDGEQIATDITGTTYTDADLSAGTYTYYATAVVDDVESNPSNEDMVTIVGINELAASSFNVYPNPTNGVVNIESDLEMKSVRLVNLTGQVVYSAPVSGSELQFNASEFTTGVYTLQIETEAGVAVHKLIIK